MEENMSRRDEILHQIWSEIEKQHRKRLESFDRDIEALYKVQISTNLLFDYAYQHQDIEVLDQLADLYLIPYDHLEQTDNYWFFNNLLSFNKSSNYYFLERAYID